MATTEPKVAKEAAASIYEEFRASNKFRLLQLSSGSDDVTTKYCL